MFMLFTTDQAETVSRRVEKFAELMQSVWMSKNDYERRIRAVSPLQVISPILHANSPASSSFSPPSPKCKPAGRLLNSQVHIQTPKNTHPNSQNTNRPRNGPGWLNGRISRPFLGMCRLNWKRMGWGNIFLPRALRFRWVVSTTSVVSGLEYLAFMPN